MLENQKLRLRFEKTKRAVFSSHLDLMRTMQRAFLRADLPLKYSEGFNPHAQISILLPLSLGMSSVCELMDFRLNGDLPLEVIPQRLNAVLPEGIIVLEAYVAERKVKEIKWLDVEGSFQYDELPAGDAAIELADFFSKESIIIQKKTKRGVGESDIAPAIKEIKLVPDQNRVLLRAVISAQEPTLNPDNLVNALKQLYPGLAPDYAEFTRIQVYDSEMREFR